MYNNDGTATLTFKNKKPKSEDYEKNLIWNEASHNSKKTALNISIRIRELYALTNDAEKTLVKILKEIEDEITY